jgi:hypothetical protein
MTWGQIILFGLSLWACFCVGGFIGILTAALCRMSALSDGDGERR